MATMIQTHVLQVTVVEAQNLARTNEWNEGSDSFCELRVNGNHIRGGTKTSVQKHTLSPKWNDNFHVELSHSPMNDVLTIYVYGEKAFGKAFIGRVEIPVTLLLHGALVDGWFKLLPQIWNSSDLAKKSVTGNLHLLLHYQVVQKQAPIIPVPQVQVQQTQTSRNSTPPKQQTVKSTYPGTSGGDPKRTGAAPVMVSCPICSRPFSEQSINAHLDYCTSQPQPQTQTQSKPKSSGDLEPCPVCSALLSRDELPAHVDACLSKQPTETPVRKPVHTRQAPSNELEEKAQVNAVLIASKLDAEKRLSEQQTKERGTKQQRHEAPSSEFSQLSVQETSGEQPIPPFNPFVYPSYPMYPMPQGMSQAPPFNPAFIPQPMVSQQLQYIPQQQQQQQESTTQSSTQQQQQQPQQIQSPYYPSLQYMYAPYGTQGTVPSYGSYQVPTSYSPQPSTNGSAKPTESLL